MKTSHAKLDPARISLRILGAALLGTLAIQVALLLWFGNGLAKVGDPHSEADALRSAQAYAHDGLWSYHGLPRILYGTHYPHDGTVKDHVDADGNVPAAFRAGFPERLASRDTWVYTHYPPGPNLLCGALVKVFGDGRVWCLRLFPVLAFLLATGCFFHALLGAFGPRRGGWLVAACALAPMFHTYAPGLHFQGWSFTLWLLQLALLVKIFFGGQPLNAPRAGLLFLVGFLQGWLSFDLIFVTGLAVVPFWLWRGEWTGWRKLFWLAALPTAGFVLAHILHFGQVAAELGGTHAALNEFRSTAAERAGNGDGHATRLSFLMRAGYLNVRETMKPTNWNFGPLMLLAGAAAGIALLRGRITRPVLWALAGAFVVSAVWLVLMPQHVVGNAHITVRHFFLGYFFLCLALIEAYLPGRADGSKAV